MPVANLIGFRPGARFDGVKWVNARIMEGVTNVLVDAVEIDLQTLPDYPDPTNPPKFNFTTTHATQPSGMWYWVVFLDATLNEQPAGPVFFGGISEVVPTVDDIRAESRVVWEEFGYAAPATGELDLLELPLLESIVEFQALTGIDLTGAGIATDKRAPLFHKAVRMLVEYNVARGTPEILETVADFDLLSSMSVGSYSETRRSISANKQVRHPYPGLNKLLDLILGMDATGRLIAQANVPVVGYDRHIAGEEIMRPKVVASPFEAPQILPRVLVSGIA